MVTGAAMGVGAAVAGLAWYARRRALRLALAAVTGPPVVLSARPVPAELVAGRWRRRGA
jgi:hypothetical protein